MHELLVIRGIDNVVGEVDQELSKTALGGRVVSQNRREGGVTERLWQALAERFTSAGVVAQADRVSHTYKRQTKSEHTEESSAQRA
jgi:hypothetical protein